MAKPEPPNDVVENFIARHPDGADFQEIADVFGCSHQRIQQVLAKAIRKIFTKMIERGVLHLDDVI